MQLVLEMQGRKWRIGTVGRVWERPIMEHGQMMMRSQVTVTFVTHDTVTCSCRCKQRMQCDGSHALTLMGITKDLCTMNDTTKRPCILLPYFTPLRSLREGSFASRPQSCLDTARCLYLQNEMYQQFLLFKSLCPCLYLQCKHKVWIETYSTPV